MFQDTSQWSRYSIDKHGDKLVVEYVAHAECEVPEICRTDDLERMQAVLTDAVNTIVTEDFR